MSRASHTGHTGPEHPSQLDLDRLLAGEPEGAAALRAHLDACERCRERHAALAAEQEALMTDARVAARVDAIMTALEARAGRPSGARAAGTAPGRTRRWLPRWAVWAPAVAAAAVALLVLWPRDIDPGRTRAPGLEDPPALQVLVVEPGGTSRPLSPGETVAAGTALGFRAGCDRRCMVLLAAMGETGPARIIEHDQPAPWHLVPGQWHMLPAGIELGGTIRVAALFCERAPARATLIDLLERHPAAAAGQPRDLDAALPDAPRGCVLRSVLVTGSRN